LGEGEAKVNLIPCLPVRLGFILSLVGSQERLLPEKTWLENRRNILLFLSERAVVHEHVRALMQEGRLSDIIWMQQQYAYIDQGPGGCGCIIPCALSRCRMYDEFALNAAAAGILWSLLAKGVAQGGSAHTHTCYSNSPPCCLCFAASFAAASAVIIV